MAEDDLGWDVTVTATAQPGRPVIDIFTAEIGSGFSKYRLAKAFLRWLSTHTWTDLTVDERSAWVKAVPADGGTAVAGGAVGHAVRRAPQGGAPD